MKSPPCARCGRPKDCGVCPHSHKSHYGHRFVRGSRRKSA